MTALFWFVFGVSLAATLLFYACCVVGAEKDD